MDLDLYILQSKLSRGEYVVLWMAHLGAFLEFNRPDPHE